MKPQLKIKISFLVSFLFFGLSVFSQNAVADSQKALFENISSFQQFVLSNLNLQCGNEENLNFTVDSSLYINNNSSEEEPERKLRCDENMIIYQPYGEFVPGSYYSETKIEILDVDEIIFSIQVTIVGNRYEYYECTEIYYFKLSNETWERITY